MKTSSLSIILWVALLLFFVVFWGTWDNKLNDDIKELINQKQTQEQHYECLIDSLHQQIDN